MELMIRGSFSSSNDIPNDGEAPTRWTELLGQLLPYGMVDMITYFLHFVLGPSTFKSPIATSLYC
jgi:hypothetical protein